MKYWIKERHNPQLPKPYFVACGQLNAGAVKRSENPICGTNIMHGFVKKEDYEARLKELRSAGASVHPRYDLPPR